MQRFVAKQNIQHFKDMLGVESNPERRTLLEGMIAEEEAKLLAKAASKAPGKGTEGEPT